MARQHGGYTRLTDDDCSSTTSGSSNASIRSSAPPQPRVVILRNIAATPAVTSPTRANVLESLVPLSAGNAMRSIITVVNKGSTSKTTDTITSPTSTLTPTGTTGAKEKEDDDEKN
ncbi:hypothetical protein BGX23_002552 [Mortierella sp. AD031]|nr:hypothetical protein BGX23_002552 [Mortierella sp. AD031]KAG0197004.1 hypothetical protein BGX33_001031 [Mortierella sp. NVP41]